jgi:tetrahydromethanopterin S-methyltransferase subunit H
MKTAVVLGWSPRATSLPEKMDTIRNAIETAKSAGIEKMLIDPATMPVGAGFGLDIRTLIAIKSELGLPTCSGSHNAPSAWKFLKDPEIEDETTQLSAIIASTIAAQLFAADTIMYGSMIRTKQVFTAVSMMANAIATSAAESQRALGETMDLFEPPTFE